MVEDADVQVKLGDMFCVAQDYVEAVRFYLLAAAQGYAHAQFNLGYMYQKGQGVAKDYA